MAFRVRPFYNLDGPVGKGKSRRPDDVMLVRLLLNNAFDHPGLLIMTKPGRVLATDSSADDSFLEEWIVTFQTAYRQQTNPNFLVDGIVDPARGYSRDETTHTHTAYTIVLLNNLYLNSQPTLYSHIWDDPKCPPVLKQSLINNVR